jgi:hypothetical protein
MIDEQSRDRPNDDNTQRKGHSAANSVVEGLFEIHVFFNRE